MTMRERDYGMHASNSNEQDDDLDRALNTALGMYATVEAREGLEQRILANLRSQESSTRSKWWTWGLAAAVLTMIIVAVAWHFNGHTLPPIANHPAIQQPPANHAVPHRTENTIVRDIAPVRKRVVQRTSHRDSPPKLDQFPSPQPLSTEEIALAEYVKKFPNEAQLVAQAQEEFALETQKVMNDSGSETRPSTSIEEER